MNPYEDLDGSGCLIDWTGLTTGTFVEYIPHQRPEA